MDFEKICEERYSVRAFADKMPEEEKIEKLLAMARLAPTACNNQPYEIFVLRSEEAIAKIREITPCAFDAPLVFVVCADEEKSWRNSFSGEPSVLQDIGIVTTTLMYGATELGLASTYVCHFDPERVKKEFLCPIRYRRRAFFPWGILRKTQNRATGTLREGRCRNLFTRCKISR